MLWSRTRSAALTWMVWTALASPSAAQETGPSRQAALPGASQAQELLVAAYPELSDRRIAWRLERDGQALIVEAREATPPVLADIQAKGEAGVLTPEAAPTVETRETPLVRARIERDTEGALTTMQIDGTLPRPPAFTAAQASTAPVEASRAAGAMFDPGDPANSVGLL